MPAIHPDATAVLAFWFDRHGHDDWFGAKTEFDAAVRDGFGETHARAERSELWQWRTTPEGRLAEIIVLDQFSRQLFRGQARAFASDPLALALAQELVARGEDDRLPLERRIFSYMPYMHSESLAIHDEAMRLFAAPGMEETLKFEAAHRDTLVRFGRYPMRNAALGRVSTPEETAYMAERAGKMF